MKNTLIISSWHNNLFNVIFIQSRCLFTMISLTWSMYVQRFELSFDRVSSFNFCRVYCTSGLRHFGTLIASIFFFFHFICRCHICHYTKRDETQCAVVETVMATSQFVERSGEENGKRKQNHCNHERHKSRANASVRDHWSVANSCVCKLWPCFVTFSRLCAYLFRVFLSVEITTTFFNRFSLQRFGWSAQKVRSFTSKRSTFLSQRN